MVHLDAHLAQEDAGDKGLKGGALGFVSSVVVGVASTAPAYSLAATLGFVVIAINGLQAPIITIIAFVPMLCHLLRVQGAEQRRPRLRHHVHLGCPGLRAEDRLVGWLGDRRGRHPRDGQPGPGRRAVRVPPLRRQHHRAERQTAGGCCWSGSGGSSHDGDLLRRDRDLGQLPEGAARHRGHHAAGALGGRAGRRSGNGSASAVTSHLRCPGSTRSPCPTPRASWSASPSCCSSTGAGTPRCRSTRRPRSATRSRAGPPSRPRSSCLATYAVVILATQSYAGIGTKGIGL